MPPDVLEYFNSMEPKQRAKLVSIREVILREVPNAEECISYKIPAVRYKGKILLYYAGFTGHVSIYPIPRGIARELEPYVKGKGTLSFDTNANLPLRTIHHIVQAHVRRIDGASR